MVQQEISSQFPVPSCQCSVNGFTGNWQLGTGNCPLLCCSANVGRFTLDCQISGAGHARLVLRAAGDGLCCPAGSHALHAQAGVRAPGAAGDAMPSCDGTVEADRPESSPDPSESSEPSFQATDDGNCCQNHCCCGATTSEWAQPASNLLSCLSLLIEPARPAQSAALYARDISGHDSARAPPRS